MLDFPKLGIKCSALSRVHMVAIHTVFGNNYACRSQNLLKKGKITKPDSDINMTLLIFDLIRPCRDTIINKIVLIKRKPVILMTYPRVIPPIEQRPSVKTKSPTHISKYSPRILLYQILQLTRLIIYLFSSKLHFLFHIQDPQFPLHPPEQHISFHGIQLRTTQNYIASVIDRSLIYYLHLIFYPQYPLA